MCWVTGFRNPLRKPGNLAPAFLKNRTVQIYSVNIPPSPHYIFIGGTGQDADMGLIGAGLMEDEWKWFFFFFWGGYSCGLSSCRDKINFTRNSSYGIDLILPKQFSPQLVIAILFLYSLEWVGWSAAHAELIFCWNYTREAHLTAAFYCRLWPENDIFSRQIQTLNTCRYAQSMQAVAAIIQTLVCDLWLCSCLVCFVPFKQSHIYILHLGGPGRVIITLLFFLHAVSQD